MNAAKPQAVPADDEVLLRGEGTYVDDVVFTDAASGVVLRSPHAHGRIRAVDARRAAAMPGVVAVFTGADLAGIVKPIPCVLPLDRPKGAPSRYVLRPILAHEVVRHVGDPVAFVVAEDLTRAREAAEAITVDYAPDAACIDPRSAAGANGTGHPASDAVCIDWTFGDPIACAEALGAADHVVSIGVENNRIVVNPMETRNAVGAYDPVEDRLTLLTGTQGVHLVRETIADILGLDRERLDVRTPHVGGGFGAKIFVYPEQMLVLVAARHLRRPVKWVGQRSEGFVSDTQARAHHSRAELALDADGRFRALRIDTIADLGAYVSMYAPFVAAESGATVCCGAYRIPVVSGRVRGVLTNTVPIDAYRGAGRPEATYLLERLIDKAAGVFGIDRAELRRRNLPGDDGKRVETATGLSLQPGRFAGNMDRALIAADYAGFAARRRESRTAGRLRGIGFANYLEANGGLSVARKLHPGNVPQEGARLRIGEDGAIDLWVGTQSTGQRHRPTLAGLVAARLGLEPQRVTVHQGNSAALAFGGGTGGSRSLIAGLAATEALYPEILRTGRARMAELFDIAEADVDEDYGTFRVAGTNTALGLVELAARSGRPIEVSVTATYERGSHANGCHICEVEIDPDTGRVEIVSYLAVDDFGALADPQAVYGQVCGGVAQGIGQALCERTVYDKDTGQLLTGSFNDYAIPRADDLPAIQWIDNGRPTADNALGIKACGEAGASGAPAAVMNAIANALSGLVPPDAVQMPATPAAVHAWLRTGKRNPG